MKTRLFLAVLLLSGCAASTSRDLVRPARMAVSEAADAVARAQEVELLRIRVAVMNHAMRCDRDDGACLDEAVEAGFEDEEANVSRITTLGEVQRELALAIQAFDACTAKDRTSKESAEACQARALAALRPMLPKVQALTEALRKAVQ